MEKNQTSCPKAVCEKIFRAITFGPAFSTIRRISSPPPAPSSAKLHAQNNPSLPNSDPPIRTLNIKTKLTSPQRPKPATKEASEVPIKFDYTPHSVQNINGQLRLAEQPKKSKPSAETSVLTGPNKKSKVKAEKGKGNIQVEIKRNHDEVNKEDAAGKKTTHYDDRFSAFIHKTRKRITSRDHEHGENSPKAVAHGHGFGKDHHFSDYIDKTKRKIRTTSSIKDRSESFFM